MQQLQFEHKWAKTIAPADRLQIEVLFEQTKAASKEELFSPIRTAVNHRKDLLVSVLIHNRVAKTMVFEDTEVACFEREKLVVSELFTIKHFEIQPFTSMPWTFIFKGIEQVEQLDLYEISLHLHLHVNGEL